MDSYSEDKATQDAMNLHNEERARATKKVIDSFTVKAVDVSITCVHMAHSHCCQCGAEAHGWDSDTRTWWCERCAAAWDHKKLAKWFQENFSDEIKEGSLADNVMRLLAKPKESA